MKQAFTSQEILTFHDAAYPESLRQISGAPRNLFFCGNVARLKSRSLAIVGARNPTPDGLDNAYAFAKHLAANGFCIVSGLATGVDGAAHLGALDAGHSGASTIAVLGSGLDIIYPACHLDLARRILDQDGLLVTEFPPGTPPLGRNFPKRNRIVAGLGLGVIVVEAAHKSGSLITAKLANDMGREVFAIPGSIHSPLSRGPHALIQQGAKLVENATDILSELAPEVTSTSGAGLFTSTDASSTDISESPLFQVIGYDPVSEDVLLRRSKMSFSQLSAELLALELQGIVVRYPDGRIAKVRRKSSSDHVA